MRLVLWEKQLSTHYVHRRASESNAPSPMETGNATVRVKPDRQEENQEIAESKRARTWSGLHVPRATALPAELMVYTALQHGCHAYP
eukprot:3615289-Amphidinium_carterae.5